MTQNLFNARSKVLNNGIQLVTIKRETRIASIQCGIKIGSLYEELNQKGISHFVEHMLFKGTAKRDNEKLNSDLENLGGEYNAYTDYTSTVYSVTVLEEELEGAVEILSDMLTNSVFPEEQIQKERGVILAEIRTSKDDVEDYSFKRVNEIGFKDSPLKYDVIGEERTVKKFKGSDLKKFYSDYYIPNNCYITVVSSLEHESVVEMINKYFEAWQSKEVVLPEVKVECNIPGRQISYKNDIEQCTITYLYTFHHLKKEEELALKIINHKLGESTNSILFRELREELGLAYDVYTTMDMTSNVKTFYIYTAVSIDRVDEAILAIDECISRLKNEEIPFNDDTMVLMKKVIKTAVASTMEDSTDLGNYVLHQQIDGEDMYSFLEDMENLEKIKKEDIYITVKEVLNNPTIHILMSRDNGR
jgi:predicted Zn-dependent peptidase